jgi:hypothetical protein
MQIVCGAGGLPREGMAAGVVGKGADCEGWALREMSYRYCVVIGTTSIGWTGFQGGAESSTVEQTHEDLAPPLPRREELPQVAR